MIDVSKDAHGTWEAVHCVIQKTMSDCYGLHLEPSCHIDLHFVHCYDTR